MNIDEQINILKLNGRNFSIENFNDLILYISKNNIIKINYLSNVENNYLLLKKLLLNFYQEEPSIVSNIFIEKFLIILDSYDLTFEEDSDDIRELKNYLSKENNYLQDEILEFMKKHSKLNKTKMKNFENCLVNLNNFDDNDSVNKINRLLNFSKTNLYNLISVLPNVIINKSIITM